MSLIPGIRAIRTAGRHQNVPEYSTDVNFIVGAADRGDVNEVFAGNAESIYRRYGAGDLVNFVHRANLNGANNFRVVRVLGASPIRASKAVTKSAAETGKLTAKDVGTYGNSLDFKLVSHITGELVLYVRYKGTLLPNGIIGGIKDGDTLKSKLENHPVLSNWIYYAKTNNNLPDEVTSWTLLTSGSNGGTLANSDVIGSYDSTTGARTGLQLALTEQSWSNIAAASFEGDAAVNAALVTVCSGRGRGRTIITHTEALSDAQIKTAADAIDAPDGCAAMYAGWYESYTQPGVFVSPVAALIGILSRNEVFESPSNQAIMDAVALKSEKDTAQIDDFLNHKVNVVARGFTRETGTHIKTFHSLSLTSDTDITEIQYRGVYDQIANELNSAVQFSVSKPNTSLLRDMVQDAAELVKTRCMNSRSRWATSIVEDMWVQCNDQNNQEADKKAKRLFLDWAIKPIDAAHYINVRGTITSGGVNFERQLSEVIV